MCNYTKLILPALGWLVGVLSTALNAGAANPPVPWDVLPNVSLPPPSFADMETSTNVPLPNLARQSGRFVFSLGCLATPTNSVEGGECRCGFDDPPADDNFIPTPCVVASPSMAVSFSSPAVMFENYYENRQGESHDRRSTRVCISVTAYGGQHGGVLTMTSANLSALQTVAGTTLDLPGSLEIPAGMTFHTSAVFEGRLPSTQEGDIEIAGTFCENETGNLVSDSKNLTSVQLAYHPHDVPEANSHAPNRHVVGVRELGKYQTLEGVLDY